MPAKVLDVPDDRAAVLELPSVKERKESLTSRRPKEPGHYFKHTTYFTYFSLTTAIAMLTRDESYQKDEQRELA